MSKERHDGMKIRIYLVPIGWSESWKPVKQQIHSIKILFSYTDWLPIVHLLSSRIELVELLRRHGIEHSSVNPRRFWISTINMVRQNALLTPMTIERRNSCTAVYSPSLTQSATTKDCRVESYDKWVWGTAQLRPSTPASTTKAEFRSISVFHSYCILKRAAEVHRRNKRYRWFFFIKGKLWFFRESCLFSRIDRFFLKFDSNFDPF